jgi:hypothetical protein
VQNQEAQLPFVRLFIDAKEGDKVKSLKNKIVESVSDKSDIFKDLTQLSVTNLYKRNEKTSDLLLVTDNVIDVLQDDDVVEFELTSYDVWVKVNMTLINRGKTHNSSFEVRVSRESNILQFKHYLYKSVITMWNQMKMHNLNALTFYFLDYVKITK